MRRWIGMAGLFVAYFATATLGLAFDVVSGVATTVWPPAGISLAALLLLGFDLWPAITLASFFFSLHAGAPPAAAAGISAGNTVAALAGAWLLRRVKLSPALERVRDTVALVVVAALASSVISATVGVGSLWLAGGPREGTFAAVWRVWWVGYLDGTIVVASLLMTWSVRRRFDLRPRRIGEAALVGLALVGSGLLVFLDVIDRAYLTFPAILWAALRFGPRGATIGTFVMSAIAVVCTYHGVGPFSLESPHQSLFELQAFVPIIAATALVLGSSTAERRQAVQLRDEFLSVASHELKTPLTALKLRVQSLLRSLRRDAAAESLVTKVTMAEAQVNRIQRLVDELLDVSRISSGRLHLELQEVDLTELVRNVSARLLGESTLKLQLAEARIAGHWDPVRLEQVLTNLIANAMRHGAPPIEVALRREGACACLVVADHGPGLPRADRERVFERFEQGSRGLRIGGLGLGLYISRQIVRAHGGTIRVENAAVGGAVVTVELPLTSDGQTFSPSPDATAST